MLPHECNISELQQDINGTSTTHQAFDTKDNELLRTKLELVGVRGHPLK